MKSVTLSNIKISDMPTVPSKDNAFENIPSIKAKTLRINLNPDIYGTFAEIGAGQETARQFFRAGGASGTIAKAMSAYGRLDVLVNNAGVTSRMNLLDSPEEDWDRVLDINAKGSFLGIKAVIPAMRKSGGGSIVNISSQLGLVGGDFSSPQYQASKGAVRILTKSVAIQYASEGIRCNSVHPAPIETDMTAEVRADKDRLADMVSRIPMGRYGRPEEVAYAVIYLASCESSFVTGSELVVDGGWTAQ